MAQQEFEGRSVAEASIAACEALGVMRKELIYTIVSESGEALDKRVVLSVDVEATKAKASEPQVAAVDELEDEPLPDESDVSFGVDEHAAIKAAKKNESIIL